MITVALERTEDVFDHGGNVRRGCEGRGLHRDGACHALVEEGHDEAKALDSRSRSWAICTSIRCYSIKNGFSGYGLVGKHQVVVVRGKTTLNILIYVYSKIAKFF